MNNAWYGLKPAGKVVHDDLVVQRLAEAGYKKAPLVEGFYRQKPKDIDFSLAVDDFLIQCTKLEDLEHLQKAVQKYYKFKVDLGLQQENSQIAHGWLCEASPNGSGTCPSQLSTAFSIMVYAPEYGANQNQITSTKYFLLCTSIRA